MTRGMRIGLITAIVTLGMFLFLRLPFVLLPTATVGTPSREGLPRAATITLARAPEVSPQLLTGVAEDREEMIADTMIDESPSESTNSPQPDRQAGDHLKAIARDTSFVPDMDIASVKASYREKQLGESRPVPQTYVSLGQVTEAPQFDQQLLSSRIAYPQGAKRQGLEATVVLRLYIGEDGTIDDIVVQEDPGFGFAVAAMDAFTDLVVEPAKIDGNPVAVTMLFPITFSLR